MNGLCPRPFCFGLRRDARSGEGEAGGRTTGAPRNRANARDTAHNARAAAPTCDTARSGEASNDATAAGADAEAGESVAGRRACTAAVDGAATAAGADAGAGAAVVLAPPARPASRRPRRPSRP